jgi:hypothetical protein
MATFDAALDVEDGIVDTVTEVIDRHAEAIWVGLIGAALAWDAWLVRADRRTLSEATRCPVGVAAITITLLHFAGLLGRYDPFNAACRLIPRR